MQFYLSKINYDNSDTFFFFFFYLAIYYVFIFWDFRDALCVGSPFFSHKLYEFGNKNLKRYNFETAYSTNLKFTS